MRIQSTFNPITQTRKVYKDSFLNEVCIICGGSSTDMVRTGNYDEESEPCCVDCMDKKRGINYELADKNRD